VEPLEKDHVYNKAELASYNGTNEARAVLIAIRGKVFDVTAGRTFYGPGGPYGAFAGVDASRMLAKMQTAPDELDPAIHDLTASEINSLESWEQFFGNKYPLVGTYAE
jgi:membrane-associated progesterone receptor component